MLETLLRPDDAVERCGLILRSGEVVELPNVAECPEVSFEMDPEALLPHVAADAVEATWHTHPDSDPILSGADYEGFLAWPDLVHHVIGRRDGKIVVASYRVEDGLVIACD